MYTAVSSGMVSKAVVLLHSNTSSIIYLKNPLGCLPALFPVYTDENT